MLVGWLARRLWDGDTALASMLALACSPYFMALGGIITLDMGLTLWMTATLFAFLAAERARDSPKAQRAWMLCAWAAMALAVLSKGLVGIIFAGAAVFFAIALRRNITVLSRLHLIPGLAVFLAIAAPWFVAVSVANEEFAQFFFIHEHFARFLTRAHRRVEPWWYFVPFFVLGFLPWMFALPPAIVRAWRDEAGKAFQPLRISILWSASIFIFFSASGSKLPTYVLPAFPPLAVVLGRYLARANERTLAWLVAPMVPLSIVAYWWTCWEFPLGSKDAWMWTLNQQMQPWAVGALSLIHI